MKTTQGLLTLLALTGCAALQADAQTPQAPPSQVVVVGQVKSPGAILLQPGKKLSVRQALLQVGIRREHTSRILLYHNKSRNKTQETVQYDKEASTLLHNGDILLASARVNRPTTRQAK